MSLYRGPGGELFADEAADLFRRLQSEADRDRPASGAGVRAHARDGHSSAGVLRHRPSHLQDVLAAGA